MDFLKAFLIGGAFCVIGQLLINTTKMTSARILVGFLLAGVVLETVGVYDYIRDFGGAGASVPIIGFGSSLARGAIEGALENGLLGAVSGGIEAAAPGIAAVIFIAFIVGLVATPKTK
ncbi:MAG TPA: SpoVA/SpoVAEb family sporulation membrane protein [Candidatus Stercoripulliclostridium merdigallinarum]|uniref:SpoVA/SpoVAEb family sporulation membrane protein n=1 Tax=Candidatus Stercoripulliclostridium merdigallinarum TaxID=2840951 RepID=A0A9D1SIK3_9FIRM|nr:SpoVA/SpoVAEb family sporulation membrane protein [Candidatus Stercoripulliclostridium merdigallinarum]